MVTVYKTKIFDNKSRGASLPEVVLAISIIAIAAPFMYKQIERTYSDVEKISVAQKIVDTKNNAMNFVRMHQDEWGDNAEIQLTDADIEQISPMVVGGIIDKRQYRGATVTDVYLAFDVSGSEMRANQIAHQIGSDAAVVGADGVAYSTTWAVSGADFRPGNLIYRISHNFATQDRNNFLHRTASDVVANDGDTNNNLNAMLRDLNMGAQDMFDVGTVDADYVSAQNVNATFLKSDAVSADTIYFASGANIQGDNADIDTIRALGDISGFKNITANNLNGNSFSNTGAIITDSATVHNSIQVGNLLRLKSITSRTVDSFTAIVSNALYAPHIVSDDMLFNGGFGLTISGELLVSGGVPLQIGNWAFPSNQMPAFKSLKIGRTEIPAVPNKQDFSAIMSSGWQSRKSVNQ